MSLTRKFSKKLRCTVKVLRDGGKDRYGGNKKEAAHFVTDCMIAPSTAKDLVDWSDQPNVVATLYGPIKMDVLPSDRIVVPDRSVMAGVYRVVGRPSFWPLGTAIGLEWVRDLTPSDIASFNEYPDVSGTGLTAKDLDSSSNIYAPASTSGGSGVTASQLDGAV